MPKKKAKKKKAKKKAKKKVAKKIKTRLVFSDGKSNKFWEISVDGNSHTVTYGRIGSTGQTKTKTFADEESAQADAEKMVSKKVKKGYQEDGDEAPTPKKIKKDYGPLNCYRVIKVDSYYTVDYIDDYTMESWEEDGGECWRSGIPEIPEAGTVAQLKKQLENLVKACELPVLEVEGLSWRYEGCRE